MFDTLNALEEQKDIWIFGYGSLIWRPEFAFEEARPATLHGYSRSLCLWSCINRGTPEQPGLVFGLKSGGICEGRVFRLPNEDIVGQFRALWKREMPSESYIPMWLDCQTPEGIVKALVFVMDTQSCAYTGELSEEEMIAIALTASGTYGPCHEYVTQTAEALTAAGIKDEGLTQLSQKIKARLATGA
ncbi:gamma-glutamylcyclotransferase [Pelistega sp. NLN82]|uniref:glutathione-specific gamma-glutamylcyclotransferase n=1 Tax=Pelistega ratti TaxID=2652177 RepID=A0A6L9Y893_9BURK|nr:gamma-glutamylcyclotransferase [Pelistega ratti]NEN76513.1 gamma-glutamylcyclotransferase [Pelistega ratti]